MTERTVLYVARWKNGRTKDVHLSTCAGLDPQWPGVGAALVFGDDLYRVAEVTRGESVVFDGRLYQGDGEFPVVVWMEVV